MTNAARATLCAAALLAIAPLAASADDKVKEYVGRTGLPTVREGKKEVWMEHGLVNLEVKGDKLHVTQEYRLKYPAPPIETGSERIQVGLREDYFRDEAGQVAKEQYTTFDTFNVYVDGQKVEAEPDKWMLNDEKDTATRWHNVWISFNPGETKTLKVETVSPIGWNGTERYVHFVTKDLGGWRKDPDRLEIRFTGPKQTGAIVAALEPKPTNKGSADARWVYKSSNPKRDIMIKLPADYRTDTSG